MNAGDGASAVLGIGIPQAGAVPGDAVGMGFNAYNLQRMAAAGMPLKHDRAVCGGLWFQ